jgi:hypothetical protein
MNSARADVGRRHDELGRNLALNIEVVLHRVSRARIEINGEGVNQSLPAGEQRKDVRERRVGDSHLLEVRRMLESHVAVDRIE